MKTTFSLFLSESARQELDPNAAMDMILANCKGWLADVRQSGTAPIWRGERASSSSIVHLDTDTMNRKAANTKNWYALWIDSSPKWGDYPKRLKSLICSSARDTADGFKSGRAGALNILIPFDSAKIGAVPSEDIWDGFSKTMRGYEVYSVDIFQGLIGRIAEIMNVEIDQTNASAMKISLRKITLEEMQILAQVLATSSEHHKHLDQLNFERLRKLLDMMEKNNLKNLEDLFDYTFDPEPNGFSHYTGKDLSTIKFKNDQELWVQGNVIMINVLKTDSDFKALSKALKEYIGSNLTDL